MIGIYFFSDILFGIFYGIFKKPYFSLFSIQANLQQAGSFFFGQKLRYDVSSVYSIVIILGICLLAYFVLNRKVKGVDIVK